MNQTEPNQTKPKNSNQDQSIYPKDKVTHNETLDQGTKEIREKKISYSLI